MQNQERRAYALDAIDLLSEEDLRKPVPSLPKTEIPQEWEQNFQYERYDWNDPEWMSSAHRNKIPWRAIRLYKKPAGSKRFTPATEPTPYFMIVSARDYKRMTQHKDGSPKRWGMSISEARDGSGRTKIYARRSGRGEEPKTVYAHIEVLGCMFRGSLGDHVNGWSLDNRRENLIEVEMGSSENNHNTQRNRKLESRDYGLPPGVQRRGNRFGGKICKRKLRGKKGKDGKRPVVTIRSVQTWASPEPAYRWYQNKLKELCGGRKDWAHNRKPKSFPVFPPLLESEMTSRALRIRAKIVARESLVDTSIPF